MQCRTIRNYFQTPIYTESPDTGILYPQYPVLRECLDDERVPCPLCQHRQSLLRRFPLQDGHPFPAGVPENDWGLVNKSPWVVHAPTYLP